MKRSARLSVISIVALLCFVSSIFFIRCYYHELSADELLYQYVWEKDDPTNPWSIHHDFERKVSNISEIIQTQYIHYLEINGRAVVHSIEQAFTDSMLAFGVINTLVFLLFVWLITYYVSHKRFSRNYALWAGVIMSLLLLFPFQQSLWTSVNYSPNYLWPATMSMIILILWDKIVAHRISSKWNIPIIIFAAVFGWTHEGFVVGISGGMFIYYCLNFKEFRGQALCLAIPMWITAAIMVFSPGNLSRFFGKAGRVGPPISARIIDGVDNFLHLPFFCALVLCVLILLATHYRKSLSAFARANFRLLLVLCVAGVFTLIAHTKPYSHTLVELISFILILRYIARFPFVHGRSVKILFAVLTLLFIPQQILLARDTITNADLQKTAREMYVKSPDGLTILDYPDISALSVPYIRIWEYNNALFTLYADAMNGVYSAGQKPPVFVMSGELDAVADPGEFFNPENRYPGNAPVYKADNGYYLWIHPDSVPLSSKVKVNYYPVDYKHDLPYLVRLKLILFGGNHPTSDVVEIDSVRTRYGYSYFVPQPLVRKIKSIDFADR